MGALAKLYQYFGVTGIVSILVWGAAAVYGVMGIGGRRRTPRLWIALGLALVGLCIARINSRSVHAILTDRSEELAAARARLAKMYEAGEGQEGEGEDGGEGVAATNEYEVAAGADRYAYRQRGKVERDAGRKIDRGIEVASVPDGEPGEDVADARMMKMEDVSRARWLDGLNLFCVRLVLWTVAASILLDYFRRFSSTFRAYFPLPLACRLVDALFPKTATVRLRVAERERMRGYLAGIVRKGESFLYLGASLPWEAGQPVAEEVMYRVWLPSPRPLIERVLARYPERGGLRRLAERLPGNDFLLWPVRRLACGLPGAEGMGPEFVLESGWFGRYCFAVGDIAASRAWLDALIAFLQTRYRVLAAARRTVHVVWDAGPIPEDVLRELLFLCRQTNYKLLAVLPEQPADVGFEEVVEGILEPSI